MGDLTFDPQTLHTYPAGSFWPSQLTFPNDIDGDSDADIVTSTRIGGTIWWLENDGGDDPSFTAHTVDRTGATRAVFSADINGDGYQDLLAGSSGDGSGELRWYKSDGEPDPSFTKYVIPTSHDDFYIALAADLDGDADLDIVAGGPFYGSTGGMFWFENQGGESPSFVEHPLNSSATNWPNTAQAADMDNDGDLDIVMGDLGRGNGIFLYENNGAADPAFTRHLISQVDGSGVHSVHIDDIDADGDKDVLAAQHDYLVLLENDGGGGLSFTETFLIEDRKSFWFVNTADLDNDGDTDILASQPDGVDGKGRFVWHESDGAADPVFTYHLIAQTPAKMVGNNIHSADFDGDGDIDVLGMQGAYPGVPELILYETEGVDMPPPLPEYVLDGPVTWDGNGNTYYLLDQTSWTNAKAQAEALGGHLVTINDAAEDAWVETTFGLHPEVDRGLWIGLNDIAEEGTWEWVNGEPVTYTNWGVADPATGAPNGEPSGDGDYGMKFNLAGASRGGQWNDTGNTSGNGVGEYAVVEVENGVAPPEPEPEWRVVLSDDFNDGVLDTSLWKTETSSGSVTETDGHIVIYDRGFLITQEEYSPHENDAIKITGQWTFADSYWEDSMQVVTRSDGERGDRYGEVANGLMFRTSSKTTHTNPDNALTFQEKVNGEWGDAWIASVPIETQDIFVGDVFNFEFIDDGSHVSFSMTEIGGNGAELFIEADYDTEFEKNHLVFYNREFPYTAYLDNVEISVLDEGGTEPPPPVPPTENTILGTDREDLLIGTALADEIQGLDGIDWAEGREGNDVIYGGAQGDVLKGGLGADHIFGGEDGDALYGNAGADVLYGEAGDDELRGANGHDTLHGGDGDDLVSGNSGDDALFGDAGTDTVLGGPGNDTAQGGAGDDEILGNGGNDQLFGDTGNDMLKAGSGNDVVDGGAGNDTIVGNKGADQLYGGEGDDTLRGVDGDDTLNGGAGSNKLFGGDGADTFVIEGDRGGSPSGPPSDDLEWVQWEVTEGGNGHWYADVNVSGHITWEEARSAAEAHGSGTYLATITSRLENDFVSTLMVPGGEGAAIGGFQPPGTREPEGGWQWVTGEAFIYTNWKNGEPNNYQGVEEDFLGFRSDGLWNDEAAVAPFSHYLIETSEDLYNPSDTDTIADFTPGTDVLDLTALDIPDRDALADIMRGDSGSTVFDLGEFGGPTVVLSDVNPFDLGDGDFLL
jgi:hypothetical protein